MEIVSGVGLLKRAVSNIASGFALPSKSGQPPSEPSLTGELLYPLRAGQAEKCEDPMDLNGSQWISVV